MIYYFTPATIHLWMPEDEVTIYYLEYLGHTHLCKPWHHSLRRTSLYWSFYILLLFKINLFMAIGHKWIDGHLTWNFQSETMSFLTFFAPCSNVDFDLLKDFFKGSIWK